MKHYILDLFFPPDFDELKKRYLNKNGYPDEDVVIVDTYGNVGKIIGLNTFKKSLSDPLLIKISKEIKEKGYYKI